MAKSDYGKSPTIVVNISFCKACKKTLPKGYGDKLCENCLKIKALEETSLKYFSER